MTAFYEEWVKKNTSLWSNMSESMGSFGQGGISEMASFWRESGGKSLEWLLKGGLPSRVGPSCFHQEKMDDAVKQMGLLNVAMLEFSAYMMLPVEAAFKQSIKEVGDVSRPEAWSAFGENMMRHLEKGYEGLFTSKGYLDALDMLMVSAGDARHQMMDVGEDFLTVAGIPSLREMDALSQDLYGLKKRVAALEQKDSAHKAQTEAASPEQKSGAASEKKSGATQEKKGASSQEKKGPASRKPA